jgi:hypothetical protein
MKKILSIFNPKKISASITMLMLLFTMSISSPATLEYLVPEADACSCFNFFPSGLGDPFTATVDEIFDVAEVGFHIFTEVPDNKGNAIIDFSSSGPNFVLDSIIPKSPAPPGSWAFVISGQKLIFSNMVADNIAHFFTIRGRFTTTGAHSIIHTQELFTLEGVGAFVDQDCNTESRSGTVNPAAGANNLPSGVAAPPAIVEAKFNTGPNTEHDYTLTINANDPSQTITDVSLSCPDWAVIGATSGPDGFMATIRHTQKAEDEGTETCQVNFTDSGSDNNTSFTSLSFTALDQRLEVSNDAASVTLASGKLLEKALRGDFTFGEFITIRYSLKDLDDNVPPFDEVTRTSGILSPGLIVSSSPSNPVNANADIDITYQVVDPALLSLGSTIVQQWEGFTFTELSGFQLGIGSGSRYTRENDNTGTTIEKHGDERYNLEVGYKLSEDSLFGVGLDYGGTYGSATDGEPDCWTVVLDESGTEVYKSKNASTSIRESAVDWNAAYEIYEGIGFGVGFRSFNFDSVGPANLDPTDSGYVIDSYTNSDFTGFSNFGAGFSLGLTYNDSGHTSAYQGDSAQLDGGGTDTSTGFTQNILNFEADNSSGVESGAVDQTNQGSDVENYDDLLQGISDYNFYNNGGTGSADTPIDAPSTTSKDGSGDVNFGSPSNTSDINDVESNSTFGL